MRNPFIIPSGTSGIERRRTYIYLYLTVGYMLSVISGFIFRSNPQTPFYTASNTLLLFVLTVLFGLFSARKLAVHRALTILFATIQCQLVVQMIREATFNDYMGASIILSDMVVLAFLLMLAIISQMRVLLYLLSLTSIATYGVCAHIAAEAFPFDFQALFYVAFTLLAIMGDRMNRSIRDMDTEHHAYQAEKQSLLELFHMDKTQLSEFIRLARKKQLSSNETEDLLALLDQQTQQRLLRNIAEVVQGRQLDYAALDRHIPSLTPAEREVAHHILQGHSLTQTMRALGKSESNITNVRSRIRKKLHLAHGENLRDALLNITQRGK
ncbi:MAG: hypothetical protein IJC16_05850 [Rikenellaceae bacterium]|nr:hypothetical protein [Rikenellaceae bacterium]